MNVINPRKIPLISIFFFFSVILSPLADNITGALFKIGIFSQGAIGTPSQILRLSLLVLVVAFIHKSSYHRQLKLILITTCYLLSVEAFVALFHFNFKALISGVLYSIKLIFTISCYIYLSTWINNDLDRTKYVIKQIVNYGTLVALLVLVAYFSGFHISNYSVGIATRGLFISGNGLGSVLGASAIIFISYTHRITLLSLLHITLLLMTTILLGTKASLVYVLIALSILTVKLFKERPLISIIIAILFSFYILVPLIEVLGSVFENIIYKFNKIDNKLSLLASSRDVFIMDAFEVVNLDSFNAIRILFGGGSYYAYTDFTSMEVITRKFLENDLFELFFSYGLIAVIAHFTIFIYALRASLMKQNIKIALVLTLLFLSSITMGLIFNGTSAVTYALCLAIATSGSKVNSSDFD